MPAATKEILDQLLSGSDDNIEAMTERLGMGKGHSSDYVIDHSSFVYLVDKAGKYISFFPPGTTADRMIEMITLTLSDRTKR